MSETEERTLDDRLASLEAELVGINMIIDGDPAHQIVADARTEIKDYEHVFLMIQAADRRGIKMWQEANPGKEHTWPDQGSMVEFLIGELDKKNLLLRDTKAALKFAAGMTQSVNVFFADMIENL